MRKILTCAALAAGVLTLSACGDGPEETPAAEATAETEMMGEETPAVDPAEAAAEGNDPTNNPIPPSAEENNPVPPAAGDAAPAEVQ